MKRWLRSPWFWLGLVFGVVLTGIFFLGRNTGKVMYPALDTLSSLQIGERWSNPEMLKIRALGPKAIPPLRSVLREREQPSTRFLLWIKSKWPAATKYYSHFPDLNKMSERRWTACQVLQTLGPASRPAVPELITLLQKGDVSDSNAASMALWAIGIDRKMCEQLDAAMEEGVQPSGRGQIVSMLAKVKPPSERTLRTLSVALADPSPWVQSMAVETVGELGVPDLTVISLLKQLQSTSTNELVAVSASAALWELEKDAGNAIRPVMRILTNVLARPTVAPPGGGSGGQGVTAEEQVFMAAANLFQRMRLGEPDKTGALALLQSFCDKSGRIFVRMLLLPNMLELGFPAQECFAVCRTGLDQPEDYYRLQAARLLVAVCTKYPGHDLDLDALIHDREVGVRVYAAKIHWQRKRQADVVVPVLLEALNRNKHQGYYYDMEILPAALRILAEMGPDAKPAAGQLTHVTLDPNPAIANLAAEALARINQ